MLCRDRGLVEQRQGLLGYTIGTACIATGSGLAHSREVVCHGGLRMTSGLPVGSSACGIAWQRRGRDCLGRRPRGSCRLEQPGMDYLGMALGEVECFLGLCGALTSCHGPRYTTRSVRTVWRLYTAED